MTVAGYRDSFPTGVGLTPPEQNLSEARLDFGARFARDGVASRVPPGHGPAYGTRVPAPDADGNDRGGVRLLEVEVPLGTHTGWNPRAAQTGFAWATARFDGSFVPFAPTEQTRRAARDPRPSLAERYPTRTDFIAKLSAAARRPVTAGYLLEEDVARAVAQNVGLYDRILAMDPADMGCAYLYPD